MDYILNRLGTRGRSYDVDSSIYHPARSLKTHNIMFNIIHDTVRFIGVDVPQSCAYDIIIYPHDVDTHCIRVCGREASTNLEIFHSPTCRIVY